MTCTAKRHGTSTAYDVDKCRCPEATTANMRYRKRLALRHLQGDEPRVSALGAVRRIQALMAMGWPRYFIIREALGDRGGSYLRSSYDSISVDTHRRIVELYDRLSAKQGPSNITRLRARAKGFAPPLAWDDIDTDEMPQGVAA